MTDKTSRSAGADSVTGADEGTPELTAAEIVYYGGLKGESEESLHARALRLAPLMANVRPPDEDG